LSHEDATPQAGPVDIARTWVAECIGAAPSSFEPIAPGLGHRTFHRVRIERPPPGIPASLILRIDPPELRAPVRGIPPEPELEPIRAHFEAAGIPVPASFGSDPARGFDLLEDVGDLTLEHAARSLDRPRWLELDREAARLVARLQAVEPLPVTRARRLDRALIATKARKVVEWLLPEAFGRAATAAEKETIESSFAAVADLVETAPARLAHRDYKAANIHLRGDGALVLIDLQGAFMAPPEYDLVCLLRDSHLARDDAAIDAILLETIETLPDAPGADTARLRFDALTLTRVGKDLAHYLDAARSRGDDRYLPFVATGLAYVRTAAARLALRDDAWSAVAGLFDALPLPARCAGLDPGGPSCA